MTRDLTTAQKEYVDRVNRYLSGTEAVSVGPCPGCEECADCLRENGEYHEDPWFSWQPCEICGELAGDRQSWHGIIDGHIVHSSCCTDCVLYIANGDVPECRD
jgi:hypothetical protein